MIQADRLAELVTRDLPTVVGLSLARKNTIVLFDRDVGPFQFSLDNLSQTLRFDLFGSSFQRSLSEAFEEIGIRRPGTLEKMKSSKFIEEWQRVLEKAGASRHV